MEVMRESLAEASAMVVCLDRFWEHDWSGRIYIRSQLEPCHFHGTLELLDIMEQFFDWMDYPQASLASRSFRSGPGGKRKSQKKEPNKGGRANRKREQVVVQSEKEMRENRGEMATFFVRVRYRQWATWQGQMVWTEQNQIINFRSTLELLRLIDCVERPEQGDFESFCDTGKLQKIV